MRNDTENESPLGDALERAVATLREPVSVSPEFDVRVMGRVRHVDRSEATDVPRATQASPPRRRTSTLHRRYPLALAVGLVIAATGVVLTAREMRSRAAAPTLPEVRFTLVAPRARSVAIVGDFNHWNATASPLSRSRHGSGAWAITVRMTPGRHVYSFLVDGRQWFVDPRAPRSLDDDFGQPSAVLTVLRRTT